MCQKRADCKIIGEDGRRQGVNRSGLVEALGAHGLWLNRASRSRVGSGPSRELSDLVARRVQGLTRPGEHFRVVAETMTCRSSVTWCSA
jgi:hypothetical protein